MKGLFTVCVNSKGELGEGEFMICGSWGKIGVKKISWFCDGGVWVRRGSRFEMDVGRVDGFGWMELWETGFGEVSWCINRCSKNMA